MPAFADVDLRVGAGECVLLTGPSGAGKSTLLRALAGRLPAGASLRGRLERSGRRPALLLQELESQLLTSTVGEEVAFGLRRRDLSGAAIAARVREALAQVGLAGHEEREIDALSAGERQRVLLAALLALEPAVLLLDEPTSALDAAGRRALVAALGAAKARGLAVVAADHRVAPWRGLADRELALPSGPPTSPRERVSDAPAFRPGRRAVPGSDARLHLDGVTLRDLSGRTLLREVRLRVRGGERICLRGDNGAGKSTLLRTASGRLRPDAGRVALPAAGREAARRPGRVGLLLQSPERNLFAPTVFDEVAFSLRRRGLPEAAIRTRVEALLVALGLEACRDRSPLRLSFGEQHRVALAAVLAPGPELLLLDEPFAGLDPAARTALLELVRAEQERSGAAVVLATHDDALPDPHFAHRTLTLREGRLCEDPLARSLHDGD